MLGDLKKTNFKKPESEGGAALQFELEANNFDLNSRGSYFDKGNTDDGAYDGPGFFESKPPRAPASVLACRRVTCRLVR